MAKKPENKIKSERVKEATKAAEEKKNAKFGIDLSKKFTPPKGK